MTLFSWGDIALYSYKKNFSSTNSAIWEKKNLFFIGIFFGFICITGLCIIRWNFSNHLPLSNLYESSLFLAWSLVLIYFFLKQKIKNDWLEAIISPIVLIMTTFTTLGLPKELQKSTVLVPALQSNWLMMHVSMMILSYGALIFGSLLAIILITLNFNSNLKIKNQSTFFIKNYNIINFYSLQKLIIFLKKIFIFQFLKSYNTSLSFSKSLQILYLQKHKAFLFNQIDYWSYRLIGIGFPMLTLGILSGAIWANEAWGSYWNWDPKETWALITWFIFAIYLHTRITKGWNGKKPALIASLGFFVVWICYLGVNLLGKGLHSYGWLN
jgi:cytochrome c-type biogenesis protein CcsB